MALWVLNHQNQSHCVWVHANAHIHRHKQELARLVETRFATVYLAFKGICDLGEKKKVEFGAMCASSIDARSLY